MSLRVRIYRPAKTASQSGRAKTHIWYIEPETLTARLPEPLMGWLSAGDTMTELKRRLSFVSREEAIAFAQKNGWDYTLEDASERHIKPRNYQDNFTIVTPEDEERLAYKKA